MSSSIRSNGTGASRTPLPSSSGFGSGLARAFGFACLLLLLSVPSALGQVSGGATLRGVVKDPRGAVVPNATVTLVNTARGDQREVASTEDGTYVFTSVDPGAYRVRATAQGFKTSEVTVTLSPGFKIAGSARSTNTSG